MLRLFPTDEAFWYWSRERFETRLFVGALQLDFLINDHTQTGASRDCFYTRLGFYSGCFSLWSMLEE